MDDSIEPDEIEIAFGNTAAAFSTGASIEINGGAWMICVHRIQAPNERRPCLMTASTPVGTKNSDRSLRHRLGAYQ